MGKKMTLFFPLVLLLLVGLLAGMVFAKDPTIRQDPLSTITTCTTNEYATLTYQGIECKNKTDTWTNECTTPTDCCNSGEFLKITPTGTDCFPFTNKASTYTTPFCADCCWKSEFAVVTTLGLRCAGESCTTDSDCSSPLSYCNTTIGRCVPCTQDSHCSGSDNFCNPTNKCETCTWDTTYTCSNNKRVKHCRLSDGTIKKTQTLSCPNSGTCSGGQCVCTPRAAQWGTAPACPSPSSVQCGTTIPNTTASCSFGYTATCTSTSCTGTAPTNTCTGKGTYCASGTCTNNSCSVAPQQCSSGTVSWTVGSHTCSGTRLTTNSGSSATVSNTTSGKTGSATYSCTGTSWGSATNATCTASNTCTNASTPAALTATPGNTQCTIAENDTGTYDYRIKQGTGSWTTASSQTAYSKTYSSLTNNTAYTFYMQRRNSSGSCTTWSSSTSVSCTPTASCTPVNGGWSSTAASSVACGTTHTETCTNPTPSCGGSSCSGTAPTVTGLFCLHGSTCTGGVCVSYCDGVGPPGKSDDGSSYDWCNSDSDIHTNYFYGTDASPISIPGPGSYGRWDSVTRKYGNEIACNTITARHCPPNAYQYTFSNFPNSGNIRCFYSCEYGYLVKTKSNTNPLHYIYPPINLPNTYHGGTVAFTCDNACYPESDEVVTVIVGKGDRTVKADGCSQGDNPNVVVTPLSAWDIPVDWDCEGEWGGDDDEVTNTGPYNCGEGGNVCDGSNRIGVDRNCNEISSVPCPNGCSNGRCRNDPCTSHSTAEVMNTAVFVR